MKLLKKAFLDRSGSIVLLYIFLASVWILFSDHMLLLLSPDLSAFAYSQTMKGVFFVVATAFMLYWLMKRKDQLILEESNQKMALISSQESNYLNTIDSLVDLIESRDAYTAGHSRRVAHYCGLIAEKMGIEEDDRLRLERAAAIHDIGKIAIPDSILLKPYKLNPSEYELIKLHVKEGYRVLQHIPLYSDLAEIVRHHHERYDGSGYPEGLSGDAIPLLSHIMSVADSFDAMTTSRIYKASVDLPEALGELKRLSGTSYHPDVVEAALVALSQETIDTDVTQSPVSAIEEERMSYYFKDSLTGFYTTGYLQYLINQRHFTFHCVQSHAIDMHQFSDYNNRYGWSMGDQLLQKISGYLHTSQSTIVRFHGDSFLILCNKDTNVYHLIDTINQNIADTGVWISIHHVNITDALNTDKEIHHWLSDMIHAKV